MVLLSTISRLAVNDADFSDQEQRKKYMCFQIVRGCISMWHCHGPNVGYNKSNCGTTVSVSGGTQSPKF
jgi:hypothetical protein